MSFHATLDDLRRLRHWAGCIPSGDWDKEDQALLGRIAQVLESAAVAKAEVQTKWCWSHTDEEMPHGPFDTREQALGDALEHLGKGKTFEVAQIKYVDPAQYTPSLEQLLEGMEEALADNLGFEDSVFELREGAEAAFEEFVRKYIGTGNLESTPEGRAWYMDTSEAEEVTT